MSSHLSSPVFGAEREVITHQYNIAMTETDTILLYHVRVVHMLLRDDT